MWIIKSSEVRVTATGATGTMSIIRLEALRDCFEGYVPSILATTDADGMPNVSLLSQVHYVDPKRVALSYQFFNKTRRNILATRRASVTVMDPATMAQFRMEHEFGAPMRLDRLSFSLARMVRPEDLDTVAANSAIELTRRRDGVRLALLRDIWHVRSFERAHKNVDLIPLDASEDLA